MQIFKQNMASLNGVQLPFCLRTCLSESLLGSKIVGVTAFALSAVLGPWVESSVALSADELVAVVLLCEDLERWLNNTASESEDQVKGALLLDVVVREGAAVLELLTGKDQSLLIRRDAFLVLDLGLDIFNSIRGLDLERDSLASQGLHKDLHTAAETENQVKGGLFLNVVVGECSTVLELLAGKDESLLIRGNTFLVLNLSLDVFNGVRRLDLESDGLTSQGFNKNLHTTS